ncbi:TPA: hypothetical protein ACF37V_002753 [Vibrio parahaemolyticus]|uniref:hypothetical protein n=1 Tax=Vibrio TaxID=662 RepID=UPI0014285EEB|nr:MULTISPECIES: hypothetical protein [Vibrio]EJG1636890.1 hypothetical protein [Vibrio alginolyticus]MCR9515358.1 hypothetical protein [Vibrio alginolyticus]MDY8151209.1 hypothetical protein [Vibrio sp. PBL-C16]QIR94251.1 hypothetical protein FR729_14935 [Vibrio alginolyticus]
MHIDYQVTIEYSSLVELLQFLQYLPEQRESSVIADSATTHICPIVCQRQLSLFPDALSYGLVSLVRLTWLHKRLLR